MLQQSIVATTCGILVLCLSLPGCDQASVPKSLEEQFIEDQADSTTPYGPVIPDSVREGEDGKINYETSDGSKWNVGVSKDAGGEIRYGTPEKIEKQ